MTIGTIPPQLRLGIANSTVPSASLLVRDVLRLRTAIDNSVYPPIPIYPAIYQQHLVRGGGTGGGPAVGYDWSPCQSSADSDAGNRQTLREISVHDLAYGWRNIGSNPLAGYSAQAYLQSHRQTNGNQIYYVTNEPETAAVLTGAWCANGFSQRTRSVDPSFNDAFPNGAGGAEDPVGFWDPNSNRVRPDVLAYVYLRLRYDTQITGQMQHTVLPPSLINAAGFIDSYWVAFFDWIYNYQNYYPVRFFGNASATAYKAAPIAPSGLVALHFHAYAGNPTEWEHPDFATNAIVTTNNIPKYSHLYNKPNQYSHPYRLAAGTMQQLKIGLDAYRNRYIGTGPSDRIPADILLSEMGPDWHIQRDNRTRTWSGGHSSLKRGLMWWNSWLAWLTRRGACECSLGGYDSTCLPITTLPRQLHACIHVADAPPYLADMDGVSTQTYGTYGVKQSYRNQAYLHVDDLQTYTAFQQPILQINDVVSQTGEVGKLDRGVLVEGRFLNSFTATNALPFPGRNFRRAPFGACYAVWSHVGADANVSNYGTGWVSSGTAAGQVVSATITLPMGYNTIYFPVMKGMGTITPSRFDIKWIVVSGSPSRFHGYFELNEFDDSMTFGPGVNDPYNTITTTQNVRAAMVFPVVYWASAEYSITVQLWRNQAGTAVWLGRPIILPGWCTWFANQ